MKRRLILLRHGKSDWSQPGQGDAARVLNPRGRLAATLMGAWLAEERLIPDAVCVSSAARTRETWSRLSQMLSGAAMPEVSDALYLAEPETLLETVRRCGDARTVLLVGHNPGLETAVRLLAPDAPPRMMRPVRRRSSPVSSMTGNRCNWGGLTLDMFRTPKDLV